MWFKIIIVVQVISALAIIGLVLLQHGKGADMGAAFGAGASGSLFGATGSSNFLSRSTAVAALVFFSATMVMAYMGNVRPAKEQSLTDQLESVASSQKKAPPKTEKPAATAGEEAGMTAVPGAPQEKKTGK
ncbi:MAG: preprotein translocase subunit SecG [Burkholderiaceae bacterium]|jgi:preprotein translocase subunit SecG|nr:preprotein translocase subunit SecG [Burkholderiaceae bacterium]